MKSLLLAVGMSVPNERQHRSSVDAGALRKNDNDDIYIYIESQFPCSVGIFT